MGTRDEGKMGRRVFLGGAIGLGIPLALPSVVRVANDGPRRAEPSSSWPGYPRHDPDRVSSIVGASHGNFDRVRELVGEQPALAKASWDWGFGDWESGLGAASHTGRREIAEFLIAHGARPTLFSAAMLGQVDVVRARLEAEPGLFELHGPHGISLMRHARAGREGAQAVVDYLLDRFGPDERPFGVEGTDEIERRYGGRYEFSGPPAFSIVVGVRNRWLLVGAGEQPNSRVLRLDEHAFHPTGAPAVRLEFGVVDDRARSLTIVDGPIRVTGVRG